ncbi:hypothetical protein M514_00842 [Trichuris suis]|uniref:FHA domain-containing protein n=1 Tax=Trichuris suis TaxID=68888 RepID=A0A085MVF8_9BILA|nr:hypothetical protein M514_00842 [Trichuris suis]
MAVNAKESRGVNFKMPTWAACPPEGFHLDVMKNNTLLQKLMIDEKSAYFFGRSPNSCDFVVDHSSCSRVHAVLVYHKLLKRMFLIDLGSSFRKKLSQALANTAETELFATAHGTFIGNVKLEAHKPEPLGFDQNFRFGASTRTYILCEKPPSADAVKLLDQNSGESSILNSIVDLAGESSALDVSYVMVFICLQSCSFKRLTEYHTALNRRVISIDSCNAVSKRSGKLRKHVQFDLVEEIINPEDIDPTVGRFRNLISTSLISLKHPRLTPIPEKQARLSSLSNPVDPIPDLENSSFTAKSTESGLAVLFKNRLGSSSLDLAPEAKLDETDTPTTSAEIRKPNKPEEPCSDKKKYPIEAWPGKYPNMHLLVLFKSSSSLRSLLREDKTRVPVDKKTGLVWQPEETAGAQPRVAGVVPVPALWADIWASTAELHLIVTGRAGSFPMEHALFAQGGRAKRFSHIW